MSRARVRLGMDHGLRVPSVPRDRTTKASEDDMTPDFTGSCENCGASPIVPLTGMCGPCTFGEADTAGGNW